ncbi:MAG: iron-sulfur cluster repair di-iron protein [bacterium]|nr:iron-sulfur cluster repair di-iron protein [bacterium]
MNIELNRTVGQQAAAHPASKRVFEKLGIDYCCGGGTSLGEACTQHGIEFDELAQMLNSEESRSVGARAADLDFPGMSLAALSDHIVREHHVFTRDENERITKLLEKVCSVHGDNHPDLFEIQKIFGRMRLELENHMLKEERMLFPYISLMESSIRFGQPVPPAPFGSTQNPIKVMLGEHDVAAEQLREMRRLSGDFTLPADACTSYRTLYQAMEGLEKDLHEHIHLENNLLFPKAIEMESAEPSMVGEVREGLCSHESTH